MEKNKIKKNIIFSLILVISLAYSASPFKVGETLNYQAYFSRIKAAKGILKVLNIEKINDIEAYHVQFKAQTEGITDRLFPINDVIDLWLSKEGLIPLRIKSNIKEGNYKKKEDLLFYQSKEYAISGNKKIKIKPITHSPYSLFYYFRGQDIAKLKEREINIIQGQKVEQLQLKLEHNIQVNVPAGNFMCTKVEPLRIENKKFKNEGNIQIYFSEDKNKYPVKIKLKLKYGSLVLKLERIIS
tara:strand:- start:2573 stop:3298 length:726 start_codon:yes stop_codon:yes gene_type:complete